jgi:3',5'-cyclic AMP phosphodiesterase CpdA
VTDCKRARISSVTQALEHDLKQNGINNVAGVIVSGDLTWKNEEAEFRTAEQFLNSLRSWSTLDSNRVAFCPGNHDLRFSADPSKIGQPANLARKDARRHYAEFYQRFYGHPSNEFLSCGRRLLVGNAVPVDLVCLNSSLLEQVEDAFQGQGFVGHAQLADAAAQMGWDKTPSAETPRAFRVLVIHHHLLPVTYRDAPSIGYAGSITWDAEAIVRWVIKHQVDLVLHGHMHDPYFARISRPDPDRQNRWHTFHIAGLGSSGVAAKSLGDEHNNTYGLIHFGKADVTVEIRRFDAKGSIQANHAIVWSNSFPYTHHQ